MKLCRDDQQGSGGCRLQEGITISEEEVQVALHTLPVREALPPRQAPAVSWRAGADIIHPWLRAALNSANPAAGQMERIPPNARP